MSQKTQSNLSSIILRFKAAIKEKFENFDQFESDFNGEKPLKFHGFPPEENPYLVEKSDALLFNDPEAYLAEISKWEDSTIRSIHEDMIVYLKKTEQLNTFKELIESFKRHNVVPFVGAGLSHVYEMPLWSKFLKDLRNRFKATSRSLRKEGKPGYDFLDELDSCIENREYKEAANIMYKADEKVVENAIRSKYTLGGTLTEDSVKGAVSILPDLCQGCIITTNYDEIIEEVYRVNNKPMGGYMYGLQDGNRFVSSLIAGKRCILKLHGNYEDPKSHILTKDQYDEAYGSSFDFSKQLPRVLRQIFISNSLLFLGCSLEEDVTLKLFKEVKEDEHFDIPDHYAILPEPESQAKKQEKLNKLLGINIRPIWYKNESGEHTEVKQILKLASDLVEGTLRV